jgi:hypothetical protein
MILLSDLIWIKSDDVEGFKFFWAVRVSERSTKRVKAVGCLVKLLVVLTSDLISRRFQVVHIHLSSAPSEMRPSRMREKNLKRRNR